jgi:aminoglycoside phosphotransferase (APT) family kinase protein
VRPALDRLEVLAEHDDELVLAGTDEVFRLPLAPSAVARQAVLVRALPVLRLRLPVAVAPPRLVGVLPDGATPFTAERRLPGTARSAGSPPLGSFAAGQLAGVLAALAAVPPREARAWGVPGDGEVLRHGGLAPSALLAQGVRLTGLTGWRLHLGAEPESADPAGAALLG